MTEVIFRIATSGVRMDVDSVPRLGDEVSLDERMGFIRTVQRVRWSFGFDGPYVEVFLSGMDEYAPR